MSKRQIEYIPIDAIRPADKNPKKHATRDIKDSYRRFGFTEPVLLDERTKKLVAGHGRIEALKEMRDAGERVPDGVTEAWEVPVTRGWSSQTDMESSAYLLADNQLTILGGWDREELFPMLDAFDDLDGTGFDLEFLDNLGKEINGKAKGEKSVDVGWTVVINCEDAIQQMMLLETLKDQGYDAKVGKTAEKS